MCWCPTGGSACNCCRWKVPSYQPACPSPTGRRPTFEGGVFSRVVPLPDVAGARFAFWIRTRPRPGTRADVADFAARASTLLALPCAPALRLRASAVRQEEGRLRKSKNGNGNAPTSVTAAPLASPRSLQRFPLFDALGARGGLSWLRHALRCEAVADARAARRAAGAPRRRARHLPLAPGRARRRRRLGRALRRRPRLRLRLLRRAEGRERALLRRARRRRAAASRRRATACLAALFCAYRPLTRRAGSWSRSAAWTRARASA